MASRLRPVPDLPPRAVLYLRQSVAREESISLELQEQACRDYAQRRGYTVVAVEADPGISGRTWKRPAVQRVMSMVEDGHVDVVLLWRWSRLSRSRLDWAVAVDRVEVLGGRIESATEPLDVSTASGRFARGMLAEVAAFESERIGEQWREAHERRRRMGLPAQGGGRFGYLQQPDGTYLPDPDTAPVLVRMYRWYLDGWGFTRIAGELNRLGVRTRRGGRWERTRVTQVLDSGFAAGQLTRGRGSARSWSPGAHPAVLSERMWRDYLAARLVRKMEPPRSTEPRYVLSGLVRCGDCGAPMHAHMGGSGQSGYMYLCSEWQRSRSGRCVSITRKRVEAAVLDWLREIAADVDAAAELEASRVTARVEYSAERRRLTKQAEWAQTRLVRLTHGFADGIVPADAYQLARDELEAEKATAEAALAALGVEQRRRAGRAVGPVVRGLLRDWEVTPVLARREVLRSLVDKVLVHRPDGSPATVEIVPL